MVFKLGLVYSINYVIGIPNNKSIVFTKSNVMKDANLIQVVISGLSNVYTHYMTTPEEYGAQRYEAASTIFGPHTTDAYLQLYGELVSHLIAGSPGMPFNALYF